LGREYPPHGNLMPLILRTNLLSKPNGNAIAIVALSTILTSQVTQNPKIVTGL
jgi:hypothetical protein